MRNAAADGLYGASSTRVFVLTRGKRHGPRILIPVGGERSEFQSVIRDRSQWPVAIHFLDVFRTVFVRADVVHGVLAVCAKRRSHVHGVPEMGYARQLVVYSEGRTNGETLGRFSSSSIFWT